MNGQLWELKNPVDDSKKYTIKRQLKRGKRQSRNIVIDSARTSLDDGFVRREITNILKVREVRVHHLILIDKKRRVYIFK